MANSKKSGSLTSSAASSQSTGPVGAGAFRGPKWDTPGPLGLRDFADPAYPDALSHPGIASGGGVLSIGGGAATSTAAAATAASPAKFDITRIPSIMRHNKWNNGAQLMETWFRNPSNNDPFKGVPDTTTVRMDTFVLTFDRAKTVYNQMIAEKVWINDKAREEIVKVLKRKGKLSKAAEKFGNFSLPVPDLDPDYVNQRPVGSLWDEVDDMFAALANFNLRAVIRGTVTPLSAGKHRVAIDAVGIYVRDSYDFNGDQHLGYWNDTTDYGGKNPFKGTGVTNQDFRDWRSANSRGGDFLVYSDLKVVPVNPKENAFEVPLPTPGSKPTWVDRHR
jgi:hypothetical protein